MSCRSLDLNSVACVPIAIGRRVIGTLTLARSYPDPELDMADVDVLGAVADRAAAALENAGLYQQQREIAETLQIVLTPKTLPRVPGFQISGSLPAIVAGRACRWRLLRRVPHGRWTNRGAGRRHRRQGSGGGGSGRTGQLHPEVDHRPRPESEPRSSRGSTSHCSKRSKCAPWPTRSSKVRVTGPGCE